MTLILFIYNINPEYKLSPKLLLGVKLAAHMTSSQVMWAASKVEKSTI